MIWTPDQEKAVGIAASKVYRESYRRMYGIEKDDLRQILRMYMLRWLPSPQFPPFLAASMAASRIGAYIRSTNRPIHTGECEAPCYRATPKKIQIRTPTGGDDVHVFTRVSEGYSLSDIDRELGRGEGYTASRLKRARLFASEIDIW